MVANPDGVAAPGITVFMHVLEPDTANIGVQTQTAEPPRRVCSSPAGLSMFEVDLIGEVVTATACLLGERGPGEMRRLAVDVGAECDATPVEPAPVEGREVHRYRISGAGKAFNILVALQDDYLESGDTRASHRQRTDIGFKLVDHIPFDRNHAPPHGTHVPHSA
jgi:hypothetical protein